MPFIYVIAVALCILRIVGVMHPSFQAIAHLFVGVVSTAAYYDKNNREDLVIVAVSVSIVEVLCALFLAR